MFKKINAYALGADRKRDFALFMLAFALILAYGVAIQFHYGWYRADSYVTTLLAFNYFEDGFFRRGLVGTLFFLVCKVIPGAYSYQGAVWFMWFMNVVYFAALITFVKWILGKIENPAVYKGAFFFSIICFAFLIPTTCVWIGALGRADLIQMAFGLWAIYLIVEQKNEWCTLLLTAVNVLFHEGYGIMTFCALMIVIIYRAVTDKSARRKYWGLLVANFLVAAVMAALSVFLGGTVGDQASYEAAAASAAALNSVGGFHHNLVYMMSGFEPANAIYSDDELIIAAGRRELPIFLVCFIPAFIVFGRAFVQLFKQAEGERKGLHITALLLGPVLIGVQFVLYCDYGRYIEWLVFYFMVMFLTFAVMGDKGAKGALAKAFGFKKNTTALLIILVMMIYQPLPTCSFTMISRWLAAKFGVGAML